MRTGFAILALLSAAGAPAADSPAQCEGRLSARITSLQDNTLELTQCVMKGASAGPGAFCDARSGGLAEGPSLHPECAPLERKRCAIIQALNEDMRGCGALLQDPAHRTAFMELLGTVRLFMRRGARFDEARRLLSLPADFIAGLGAPLAKSTALSFDAAFAAITRATSSGTAVAVNGEPLPTALSDQKTAARCRSAGQSCDPVAALAITYQEAEGSLAGFFMSLQTFTMALGKETANADASLTAAAAGAASGTGIGTATRAPAPPPADTDPVAALLAAANARAEESFSESVKAASVTIPDADSLRRGGSVTSFMFGQVRSMLSTAREMDPSLAGKQDALSSLDTSLAAAQLLTAQDDASRTEALNSLRAASGGYASQGTRSLNSSLALSAIWLESATSTSSDAAMQESFRRTTQDILKQSLGSMTGVGRPATPAFGGVGGSLGGSGAVSASLGPTPTPPASSRDATGCANDMRWLQGHLRTQVQAPFPTVEETIAASGDLDRAILLGRAQLREAEEAFAFNRDNTELRDAMPTHYKEGVDISADMVITTRVYLEALECRRAAQVSP